MAMSPGYPPHPLTYEVQLPDVPRRVYQIAGCTVRRLQWCISYYVIGMGRNYRWALDPNFNRRQQIMKTAGRKSATPVTVSPKEPATADTKEG